jgi:hypothetical protein
MAPSVEIVFEDDVFEYGVEDYHSKEKSSNSQHTDM